MGRQDHLILHNRLCGLARLVRKMMEEADAPGRIMSRRERKDLTHILKIMNTILLEDNIRNEVEKGEIPVKDEDENLNIRCEFFDLDANRIQCAIGCDMYHCSKKCVYATNVPGSLPPYGTKYMKGRLDV